MKAGLRTAVLIGLLGGWGTALGQPVVTDDPRHQSVPVGGSTTYWVAATGTEPLSYQWFFNSPGNPIPGATNDFLVITNARAADEGFYRVRVSNADGLRWSASASLSIFTRSLPSFGTLTLDPAFDLNGQGGNVDSIAFWEAPDPVDTLMFVTAKASDLLEVWKHPFQAGNQLPPLNVGGSVNGVAIDQEADRLYVSDRIVSVFSLPGLQLIDEFGQGIIDVGENNLDILRHSNGQTLIYVSDDHNVHRFVAPLWTYLGSFAPPVVSIETILADDFYQLILVPEEQGVAGNAGVYAYHPDGTPYPLNNGTNVFGDQGEFDSDEEGILLYTQPSSGLGDDGTGFVVVSDQRSDVTDFEFFDRQSWIHLGRLRLTGVSNTDGIASTQRALPGYPMGIFAAINDDTSTAGLGWDVIFDAIGAEGELRVVSVAPSGPVTGGSVALAVEFNGAATHFGEEADLIIVHRGTGHGSVSIAGSGSSYVVTLDEVHGLGYFLVSVNTASDVEGASGGTLISSVTSVPVSVGGPYERWAEAKGLTVGVDAGLGQDPDGDGDLNIWEFAVDGDPLAAAGDGKQRVVIEEVAGENHLIYTFAVRGGAVFSGAGSLSAAVDGVVYSLSGATELGRFEEGPAVVEVVPALDAGLPEVSSGWGYRTFRLGIVASGDSMGFLRLVVSGEAGSPPEAF